MSFMGLGLLGLRYLAASLKLTTSDLLIKCMYRDSSWKSRPSLSPSSDLSWHVSGPSLC